jgi:hypothetical protein
VRLPTMTLHWTFVLYSLYVEVAFASLLMLPGISVYFARLLRFLQQRAFNNKYMVSAKWIAWALYVLLFLESLRQVRAALARISRMKHCHSLSPALQIQKRVVCVDNAGYRINH